MPQHTKAERKKNKKRDAMVVAGKGTQKKGKVRKIVPGFSGLIKSRKQRIEEITN